MLIEADFPALGPPGGLELLGGWPGAPIFIGSVSYLLTKEKGQGRVGR